MIIFNPAIILQSIYSDEMYGDPEDMYNPKANSGAGYDVIMIVGLLLFIFWILSLMESNINKMKYFINNGGEFTKITIKEALTYTEFIKLTLACLGYTMLIVTALLILILLVSFMF